MGTYRSEDFSVVISKKSIEQLEDNLPLPCVESPVVIDPDQQLVHCLLPNLPTSVLHRPRYVV